MHPPVLTKDQRDEHIRRYAELLEAQAVIPQQSAAKLKTDGNPKGAGRPPGIPRQIAEETGLSIDTVRRALNPKPPAEVIPIAARSQENVILAQANAIIAAWNRASQEARDIAMGQMDGGPVLDKARLAG